MIKVENVTKRYGDKLAVNKASFEVKEGEIFGFLGPNGAGKTTTIKMIVGLNEIDEGRITVSGVDVKEDPIGAKKKFAYVPDDPDIYEKMTGYQYLNFICDVFEIAADKRQALIDHYAEVFEIKDDLNDFLGGFSHGMQQKVALIGALIHDPDVLILDEPMVGLDPKSSYNLKEIMKERCRQGKSVFFSTHVMEVAEKICDRIAIIKKGEIITIGTFDEIKKQANDQGSLEKIFLELTE